MPTVLRVAKDRKVECVVRDADVLLGDVDARVAVIQALIPLALEGVAEQLQQDVSALAGPPYARADGAPHRVRWGRQRGSVYLADQKLPIQVPRVRDRRAGTEVPLPTYERLQRPRAADEGLLRRILLGLSCRDYRACAEAVPEAFGLSRSSVPSVHPGDGPQAAGAPGAPAGPVRPGGTAPGREGVPGRHDGHRAGPDGARRQGDLGFVETGTENETVCAEFLRQLIARGLRYEEGVLVVIDGGKGLRAAVTTVFGPETPVQRCQWHKRENIVAYLPKSQQTLWRGKLQAAYGQPTYTEAKSALEELRAELKRLNESAVRSLDEGLEETLTLHRLGVGPALRRSLATTNGLESIYALVEARTGKVDRWRTSDQKQRWLAAALLDVEPRLRRVRGYRALPQLREALQKQRGRVDCERRRAIAS